MYRRTSFGSVIWRWGSLVSLLPLASTLLCRSGFLLPRPFPLLAALLPSFLTLYRSPSDSRSFARDGFCVRGIN